MKPVKQFGRTFAAVVLALVGVALVTRVEAQPAAAQIQAALAAFLQQAHTWTQLQTFGDITVTGTCTGCSGGSAPSTADFLVGTAQAGLSNEIVVGTSPGGELGGTWAAPTIDDGVTVTGWVLGVSSATTLTSRVVVSGSAPTVANVGSNSCGTTAATIAGNDNAGIVTIGATSGTQCRITFTAAAPTRWQCVANNETTSNATRALVVDTTHVDLFGVFTGGDVVSYLCLPR